jgi:hypothetical protein
VGIGIQIDVLFMFSTKIKRAGIYNTIVEIPAKKTNPKNFTLCI